VKECEVEGVMENVFHFSPLLKVFFSITENVFLN